MSQMLCFPEEVREMETKSTKPSKVWKLLKQIIYMFCILRPQVLANTEPLIGDWVEIVPPVFGGKFLVIYFFKEIFKIILAYFGRYCGTGGGLETADIDIWRSCFTSIPVVNPAEQSRGNLNFESMKSKSLAAAHLTNWVPHSERVGAVLPPL